MKLFSVRVKLVGLNILKLYKKLRDNKIGLSNIFREKYNTVFFDVNIFKLKKLKSVLTNLNYELSVDKYYGFCKWFFFLKMRLGIIFGCAIFLFVVLFSNCFVWNIKIYGIDRIKRDEVLSVLNSCGVKNGVFSSSFNLNELEDALLNNLQNISLVSVMKKGSTIIVNVKEKLYVEQLDNNNSNIIANYSGVITKLNVVQGTTSFKVGDIVKIGEIIVGGFYYDVSHNKVSCKANAEVTVKTWFSQSELYYKKIKINQKTGNFVRSSELKLFNQILHINNTSHNYKRYDTIVTEKYLFKNNILPIKLITTTIYETNEVVVEQDFEKDKSTLLKEVKQKAKNKIPSNLVVLKEFELIEELEDYFVVSAYYEIDVCQ